MKIIRITSVYPDYLKQFYTEYSEIKTKSYLEHKAALDYDAFGWADFWESALTKIGYEVVEIIANAEMLQRQWALENGITVSTMIETKQIVIEQLRRFKPEIILFDDTNSSLLKEIIAEIPSIKMVIGWTGSAIANTDIWKYINVVLSCAPESVERLQKLGCKSIHLNHAFEPRINTRMKKMDKNINLSFIGQIVREKEFHYYREQLLENLTTKTKINIFSSSANFKWLDAINLYSKGMIYDGIQSLKNIGISEVVLQLIPILGKSVKWETKPILSVNPRLIPYLRNPVFGLKMYATLLSSKISLNVHADSSPQYASNMRLFEATGVGTCLLTDWKDNLPELFEPDREVVTYKSVEECIEKVKWLLDHPQEREAIAKAGQARTLKDHTFAQRAIQLDEIIRKMI